MANSVKVELVEYEKGWDSKVDEVKEFFDNEDKTAKQLAEEFIKEYNSKNTAEKTPDWYMIARLQENFRR